MCTHLPAIVFQYSHSCRCCKCLSGTLFTWLVHPAPSCCVCRPASLESCPLCSLLTHPPHPFTLQDSSQSKASLVVSSGWTMLPAVWAPCGTSQGLFYLRKHLLFPLLYLVFFTLIKKFPEKHFLNKSHALKSILRLSFHGTWPEMVGTSLPKSRL